MFYKYLLHKEYFKKFSYWTKLLILSLMYNNSYKIFIKRLDYKIVIIYNFKIPSKRGAQFTRNFIFSTEKLDLLFSRLPKSRLFYRPRHWNRYEPLKMFPEMGNEILAR